MARKSAQARFGLRAEDLGTPLSPRAIVRARRILSVVEWSVWWVDGVLGEECSGGFWSNRRCLGSRCVWVMNVGGVREGCVDPGVWGRCAGEVMETGECSVCM